MFLRGNEQRMNKESQPKVTYIFKKPFGGDERLRLQVVSQT